MLREAQFYGSAVRTDEPSGEVVRLTSVRQYTSTGTLVARPPLSPADPGASSFALSFELLAQIVVGRALERDVSGVHRASTLS